MSELTPVTREEMYLDEIADALENGGGGGGGGFTPTTAQLAAMNSGITSEDVEQISTNKNNISILTTPIIGGVTWSSSYTPDEDTVYIRQYGNIVVVQVSAVFFNKLPSESHFEIGTLTGVGAPISNFIYPAYFADVLTGVPTSMAGVSISSVNDENKIYVTTDTVGEHDYNLKFSLVYCTS